MPEDINQLMQGEDNPDETAAVLAFSTKLSEGLLPKAQPQQPQMQEMRATSHQNPQGEVEQGDEDIDKKMEDFKKEIKDMIKEEISTIKESIQDALKEDEDEGKE